jgi:hypothetical protein
MTRRASLGRSRRPGHEQGLAQERRLIETATQQGPERDLEGLGAVAFDPPGGDRENQRHGTSGQVNLASHRTFLPASTATAIYLSVIAARERDLHPPDRPDITRSGGMTLLYVVSSVAAERHRTRLAHDLLI